ncbi:rhodanese-like domain-containing protein [Leucobacter musarum]|uniref:rhodanese-like domain-containing protein n=1 Tax=Leucobacter musarum TaxID=1930747 RepID=UPI0006A7C943|nr:rhodanese-like domain-containing protein [Leucobacter musarum]
MSLARYVRRPDAVSVGEARALIEAGALVVDVRGVPEWRRAHIPGALHLPLAQIEARWEELPEHRTLITFCTGGFVSAWAANLLVELGFPAVNLSRGLVGWRAAGGPLESEPAG